MKFILDFLTELFQLYPIIVKEKNKSKINSIQKVNTPPKEQLPHKLEKTKPSLVKEKAQPLETRDWLLEMKNKDFIYKCLDIVIANNRQDDIIRLTNPYFCKSNFDMNYAILLEVSLYGEIPVEKFRDSSLNRRYYPQPIVAFGKRYIVCNDWYYNNKVNPRDTKTSFVDWVLK